MGYSLKVCWKQSGEVVDFPVKHQMRGSNMRVGGDSRAQLAVTSNYSDVYNDLGVFRAGAAGFGIRILDGQPLETAMEILANAIHEIHNKWPEAWFDEEEDYWKPTPANARHSLESFLEICHMACDFYPAEWNKLNKDNNTIFDGFIVKVE